MRSRPRPATELWTCELGCVPYEEALVVQRELCARRQVDEVPDVLLLLEHPPTYTRGRRSSPAELPLGADRYAAMGIDVLDTDRGGRVTYHGPGQLVGYPIVALTDVVAHVRLLERAIVEALAGEGIEARTRTDEGADYTGVWVKERKIASIGVHVSRGVSTHGFAVNVDNDLAPFAWIVPCGLPGVEMTSLRRELERGGPPRRGATNRAPGDLMSRFADAVAAALAHGLGRVARPVTPAALELRSLQMASAGACA